MTHLHHHEESTDALARYATRTSDAADELREMLETSAERHGEHVPVYGTLAQFARALGTSALIASAAIDLLESAGVASIRQSGRVTYLRLAA